MRYWTHTLITCATVVSLSACGGGDDDAAPEAVDVTDGATDQDGGETAQPADATDATDATDPPEQADETDEPAGDSSAGGDNVAIVTVGDTRYEFDVTPGSIQRCDPNFFGAFWALGASADGNGIELLLPPPDDPNFDEAPRVKVSDDAEDRDWVADPDREMAGVEAGESQVDDYSVDGSSVTGSATFVDLNETFAFQGGAGDEPTPVSGTFEVRCSDS